MDGADGAENGEGTGIAEAQNDALPFVSSRGSVWLRALLREVEHSGSGSSLFWGLFWSFFPQLTEQEVWRAVHAAGSRGDGQWDAIRQALEARHRK